MISGSCLLKLYEILLDIDFHFILYQNKVLFLYMFHICTTVRRTGIKEVFEGGWQRYDDV